jgi:hypothetical protein
MWATGEWSATIQGQNFGPKHIKGNPSTGRDAVSDGHPSKQ